MLMATIWTRMWDGKLWDVTWAGNAARSLELRAAALSSSVKKIKQGELIVHKHDLQKKINHIWYSETGQHKPVHRWIQAWSCRNDVIISLTESFPFNSGLKLKKKNNTELEVTNNDACAPLFGVSYLQIQAYYLTYMSLVSLVYSFSRLVAAAGKGCLTARLLT